MRVSVFLIDGSTFFDDFVDLELADSDGVFVRGGGALAGYLTLWNIVADLFGVGVDW